MIMSNKIRWSNINSKEVVSSDEDTQSEVDLTENEGLDELLDDHENRIRALEDLIKTQTKSTSNFQSIFSGPSQVTTLSNGKAMNPFH